MMGRIIRARRETIVRPNGVLARDLMPDLRAWWEPALGGLTLAEPSVAAPNAFAAVSGLTLTNSTSDVLDPVGGNSADKLAETTDNVLHYGNNSGTVNGATGPMFMRVYARLMSGSTRRFRLYTAGSYNGNNAIGFRLSGTAGVLPPISAISAADTGTITAIGDWYLCTAYYQLMTAGAHYYMFSRSDGVGLDTYAGDTAEGLYLYGCGVTQHRCSALEDLAPLIAGVKSAKYSIAQATPANQPFICKGDGSSPGGGTVTRTKLWQPNDASRTLDCTTAELLTLLTASHSVVARVRVLANLTNSNWVLNTAGGTPIYHGTTLDRKPFLNAGGYALIGPSALTLDLEYTLGWNWNAATNAASLFVNGALVAGPTVLGASSGATSASVGVRGSEIRALGISGAIMTVDQHMAEHLAFGA